jgi:hypothetical protein
VDGGGEKHTHSRCTPAWVAYANDALQKLQTALIGGRNSRAVSQFRVWGLGFEVSALLSSSIALSPVSTRMLYLPEHLSW